MVIGMDVGTTATAAMATIGGSTDVRRTGYAHVIYNILTGVMAFFLVTPFASAATAMFPTGFEKIRKSHWSLSTLFSIRWA